MILTLKSHDFDMAGWHCLTDSLGLDQNAIRVELLISSAKEMIPTMDEPVVRKWLYVGREKFPPDEETLAKIQEPNKAPSPEA